MPSNIKKTSVRLLTFAPRGHTLNRRQALSPQRNWAVFDTRNDDAMIGQTSSIERIELNSGRIEKIYETSGQTTFGPGVGAVAYHPDLDRVVFIHGLLNCTASRRYGAARRFGAIIDIGSQGSWVASEGRYVDGEPISGILSGGTHAHSWSPSGRRISFTYDDARNTSMPRTVGFTTTEISSPLDGAVLTYSGNSNGSFENFGGRFASFLVLVPGTPIVLENGPTVVFRHAREEAWISDDRIAFLGTIESGESTQNQEIFVAKLPSIDAIKAWMRSQAYGVVPPGMTIERITHTPSNGLRISGTRHWLTSVPDGSAVYTLVDDSQGVVQLARVATIGGEIELLTDLSHSIDGQMSCSPCGECFGFIAGGKIHVWSVSTQKIECWEDSQWTDCDGTSIHTPSVDSGYVGTLHFVDKSTIIANRYIRIDDSPYLQIVEVRRQ